MAYKIVYNDGEAEGDDQTFAIVFRDGVETEAFDCEDADGGMAIVEHPKQEGTFVLAVLRDHEGQLSPDTIYELRQATTEVEVEEGDEDSDDEGEGDGDDDDADEVVEVDGAKTAV